jgi:hypothetical protein
MLALALNAVVPVGNFRSHPARASRTHHSERLTTGSSPARQLVCAKAARQRAAAVAVSWHERSPCFPHPPAWGSELLHIRSAQHRKSVVSKRGYLSTPSDCLTKPSNTVEQSTRRFLLRAEFGLELDQQSRLIAAGRRVTSNTEIAIEHCFINRYQQLQFQGTRLMGLLVQADRR